MLEILIVEDEAPIRDLLSMNLTRAGYHCTAAADGRQAAILLETHTYDLALLDIMLPEVNGYELLRLYPSNGNSRDLSDCEDGGG